MTMLMETTAIDPGTMITLRDQLRADRKSVTMDIESTKSSMASFFDSRRDVEVDDEHDPEGGTLAQQFAMSSALLENSRHHLDQINAALAKMSDGRYGSCESCGVDISLQRLEVRPLAEHCIRCARLAIA